jgi:hypothetical protein
MDVALAYARALAQHTSARDMRDAGSTNHTEKTSARAHFFYNQTARITATIDDHNTVATKKDH